MKIKTVSLIALAAAAQADKVNLSGKWYPTTTGNNICSPAGVIEISQDASDKVTIKGKWDPYSDICKQYELDGKALELGDVTVQDTGIVYKNFQTSNKTSIVVGFSKSSLSGRSTISVNNDNNKFQDSGILLNADDIKFKAAASTYKFSLFKGDKDKCCIPDSLDINMSDDGIYYADGKWADSKGCSDRGIGGGLKFEKAHASVLGSFSFEHKLANGTTIVGNVIGGINYKTNELDMGFSSGRLYSNDECDVRVTKGSSVWIWILVVVLVIVVIAVVVGVVLYMKKKRQNQNQHLLR